MVIEALTNALKPSYAIVGVAHHGGDVMKVLVQAETDCLLLDLGLPGKNGLQLIPAIRRRFPQVKVLVLTMHVDRSMAEACLAAGAHGFLPKEASIAELRGAITEVLAGRHYVSPRVPKSSHRLSLGAAHIGLQQLTPRQQDVLLRLGEGQTLVHISRCLEVSPSTVTFHKQNIMKVLGFDDEAALLQYAVVVRLHADER